MYRYFTFFLFFFLIGGAYSQDLSATMKMPESVEPGDVYTTEVTINKGPINSYIKFSQKLPANFKATELDVHGGSFTFDDSIIKIVWFFPPANNEFTFSYKVSVPDDASGVKKIGGKIYYFFNTDRQVFSFEKQFVYIGKDKKEMVTTFATKVKDTSSVLNPTVKEINAALNNSSTIVKTDSVLIPLVTKDTIKNSLVQLEQIKDTSNTTIAKPIIKDVILDTLSAPVAIKKEEKAMEGDLAPIINNEIKTPENVILNVPKIVVNPENKSVVDTTELIYSVQVGSYKEEVPLETANKFLQIAAKGYKNLKENNGYTTFVVGNFKTKEEAIPLIGKMENKGFKGAFVVAYPAKNVYSAIKNKTIKTNLFLDNKLTPKSNSVTSSQKVNSKNPDNLTEVKKIAQEKTLHSKTVQVKTNSTVLDSASAKKIYSVQIGAFKEEVPLETANKFLTLAAKGIKNLKTDLGITVYTIGNFSSREEALSLKNQLIEKGFKDAFVVAFENGIILK
jgi:cell division protein FtsN